MKRANIQKKKLNVVRKKRRVLLRSLSISLLFVCLSVSGKSNAEIGRNDQFSKDYYADNSTERTTIEGGFPTVAATINEDESTYNYSTQSSTVYITEATTETSTMGGYNESGEQSYYGGDLGDVNSENNEKSSEEVNQTPEQFQMSGEYCCIIFPVDDEVDLYDSEPALTINGYPMKYIDGDIGIRRWGNSSDITDRGIDYHIVIDISKNYKLDSFKDVKTALYGIKEEIHDRDTVTFYLTNKDKETEFFSHKYTADELLYIDIEYEFEKIVRDSESSLYSRLSEVAKAISEEDRSTDNESDDNENTNDEDEQEDDDDNSETDVSTDSEYISSEIIDDAFSDINRKVIIAITTGYDTSDDYAEEKNEVEKNWGDYAIPVYPIILRELSDEVIEDSKADQFHDQAKEFTEFCKNTGGKTFVFGSYSDYYDDGQNDYSDYNEGDYTSDIEDIIDFLNDEMYIAYFKLADDYDPSDSEYINVGFSIIEDTYLGDIEYIYSRRKVRNDQYSEVSRNNDSTEMGSSEETTIDTETDTETSEDVSGSETTEKTEASSFEKDNKKDDSNKANVKKAKKGSFKGFINNNWIIILAALLIVIVFMVLLVAARVRRKRNKKYAKQLRTSNAISRTADYVSETHTIRPLPSEPAGIPLFMQINSEDGSVNEITAYVNGSAIVGRGKSCDVHIDNDTISRQHFVFEYSRGEFYIMDLETTNGTYLNGVRLTHKRRIVKGDTIKAGALEISVRW